MGGPSVLVMVNFLPDHLKHLDRQTIFFSFVICPFRFSTLLCPSIKMHGPVVTDLRVLCSSIQEHTNCLSVQKATLKTKQPQQSQMANQKTTVRDSSTALDLRLHFCENGAGIPTSLLAWTHYHLVRTITWHEQLTA